MADVIRLEFDKERPLKVRHRFIRDAVRVSGRSISELIGDPFGGWPYLIQALVNAKTTQPITLDKASDLIDDYREKNQSIKGIAEALNKLLSDYVNLESTPTEDEEASAAENDTVPNAASPELPGRSGD